MQGLVAFDLGAVLGLEVIDDGTELRRDPELEIYLRLIDDISGAETKVALSKPIEVKASATSVD